MKTNLKKRVFTLVLFLLLSSGFAAFSHAKESAKITIKFATLLPKGSADLYEKFQEEVRSQTNNEVAFKIYYGGVQGDELDVLRKIRLKQLHGGSFTGYGLGTIVPPVRVTELPYMFKNYEEISYVREHLEDKMNKIFESNGYVPLGWYETGFAYTFSKVPITSIEVARQQKWWMWGSDPLQQAVFDAMEISPVQLSVTDVLTSLSTKMIDAAPTTPFGAVAFRWYTKFKYMQEYPLANFNVGVIVTKDIWDQISPESQKKIKVLSKDLASRMIQSRRQSITDSIKVLKDSGISIVHVDMENEAMRFVLQSAEKARDSLVGKLYSRELLDETLALLQEYREKNPNSKVARIE